MKKGRQEVCFFPRCVKRILLPRRLTNPELAHLEGCKCSGGQIRKYYERDREGRRKGRRRGEISTKFLTSRHPSLYTRQLTTSTPGRIRQTAPSFSTYVSSHDSSSDDPSYGYSSRIVRCIKLLYTLYTQERVWKSFQFVREIITIVGRKFENFIQYNRKF